MCRRRIRSKVKEVVSRLTVVGGSRIRACLSITSHQLTERERLLALIISWLDLLRSGSSSGGLRGRLVGDSGEVACVNHLEKPQVFIHLQLLVLFLLLVRLDGRHGGVLVHSVECVAIEVHALNVLEILDLLILLVVLHASSQLPGRFLETSAVLLVAGRRVASLRDDDFECVDEAALGVVESWQRDRKIEDVDKLVCLIFDGFCEVDEILIHHKRLLCVSFA